MLSSVHAARRDTLIARRKKTKKGNAYRFDVQVGGDDETVFSPFDVDLRFIPCKGRFDKRPALFE